MGETSCLLILEQAEICEYYESKKITVYLTLEPYRTVKTDELYKRFNPTQRGIWSLIVASSKKRNITVKTTISREIVPVRTASSPSWLKCEGMRLLNTPSTIIDK